MATATGMTRGVFFAGSPVVVSIEGLAWQHDSSGNPTSPFNVVVVEVLYNGKVVGEMRGDTGGQSSIDFDISTALRAIWSDYTFDDEVSKVNALLDGSGSTSSTRGVRSYLLQCYREYIDSTDGKFTRTERSTIGGGSCVIGKWTEWERGYGDVLEVPAGGSASTKPSTPERVGSTSLTSAVAFDASSSTVSMFYKPPLSADTAVLRDTYPYTDFLFVNRRGAVETCSAPTMEAMSVEVESKQYAFIERPKFTPTRSLMSVSSGGRRSWQMSSGHQRREWADWWAEEFLTASRHWMLYDGRYVPVVVKEGKKSSTVYDKAMQAYQHVDFTVTLALEG